MDICHWCRKLSLLVLNFGAFLLGGNAISAETQIPDFSKIKSSVRAEHPRIFITAEQVPVIRARATGVCKKNFDVLKKHVDALPDKPNLEFDEEAVKYEDGKVIFRYNFGDQNAVIYGLKNAGGTDAARCALLYLITGDKKYVAKAYNYLMLNVQFIELSERSRILPEWTNSNRLAAIVAYDWLYNELTPEQRRSFIVPMMRHIEFMRKPGFQRNGGGYTQGNYGEPGLLWYIGLASFGDGFDNDMAERFLRDGYDLNIMMMNFREEKSDGKGLLASISPEYSFGMYPCATNNFLMSLKSCCNIDGTKIWQQPVQYANYFNWMAIPDETVKSAFYQYGWGDTYHIDNQFIMSKYIYTHLAVILHLYGENDVARALISKLPERLKKIEFNGDFSWIPFIMTGFDPERKFEGDINKALNNSLAEHFPSYGLTIMRSGVGRDDTYASIKAGATASGHQHYDELSFIIYKGGFQALDSGIRCRMPHHRAYYAQTVAHNSLLIRMENEIMANYWYPANAPRVDWKKTFMDGGQNRMESAQSFGMSQNEYFVITGGDATKCYNLAKCREAIRLFVFVKPNYFVIYDRVVSVKPDQQKAFLLHTQHQPVLKDGVWQSTAGRGMMFVKPVLPGKAKVEVIGGPGKEFWSNGQNYPLDADRRIQEQIDEKGSIEDTVLGAWRLEISDSVPAERTNFLTVLQTAMQGEKKMVSVENISDEKSDGVKFVTEEGVTVVLKFQREGDVQANIQLMKDGKIIREQKMVVPVKRAGKK